MVTLESLGFGPFFRDQLDGDPTLVPARVSGEQRGRYALLGCEHPYGELRGRIAREEDPLKRPAAGDWVLVEESSIRRLLERRTMMVRQAAGTRTEPQVLAANVDTVFVVSSMNADFNPRRLERYLAAVRAGGAEAVIVLNKSDLADDPARFVEEARRVAAGAPVLASRALESGGTEALQPYLQPGRTVALVGSSGVGKSSLVNALLGVEAQRVAEIRAHDERGKHATTGRSLITLPSGALLLDTPGLRELQLWGAAEAIDEVFPEIASLAESCRFSDCRHEGEPGCAVAAAIAGGALPAERLESHNKLVREQAKAALRQDVHASRAAERKFGRMAKDIMAAKRTRRDGG